MKKRMLFQMLIVYTVIFLPFFSLKALTADGISKIQSVTTGQYKDHLPIIINGNTDLQNQANSEGWTGDGSVTNPYIIEDLRIVDNENSLISIQDTDLFCIIRNCYFRGSLGINMGIEGESVQNLEIQDNYFENLSTGIYVGSSSVISRLRSQNIIVIENYLVNGSHGIGLNTQSSQIRNNTILNMEYSGISGWKDIEISHNYIMGCGHGDWRNAGIYLKYAENVTVTDNYIGYNNCTGIELDGRECTVLYNTIKSNSLWGIHVIGPFNVISQNWIEDNSASGVCIYMSVENEITYNNFINNSGGNYQAFDNEEYSEYSNDFDNNHWSDWTEPDNDADGYVDEPYPISGEANNEDRHPSVTIVDILTKPTILYLVGSKLLNETINIQWTPSKDTLGHEITYSVYYSNDSGESWYLIASDLQTTQYAWDTTTVLNSQNYRIMIEAKCEANKTATSVSNTFEIKNSFPKSSTETSGLNITYILLPLLFLFCMISKKKSG